jgi:hypothetical protein
MPGCGSVAARGGSTDGLLDSGGPHLIVPADVYEPLVDAISADPAFAALGDAGAFWARESVRSDVPPEELDATLPGLRVDLDGGVALDLPATQSYVASWDEQDGTWLYWTTLLDGSDFGWDDFLDLGNLPMTSCVVLHDRAAGQVGFAPAVACE